MITHQVSINGIEVDARYEESAVEEIFLPFLREMTALRERLGRRVLVMLAAPPGAGKTTLLSFLERLAREHGETADLQALGMDGFHRRQAYLLTHETERDGRRISMVEIKGAPETFDLDALTRRVRRVAAGENCPWPIYDRILRDPVEDALTVESGLVLLEGNYLLLDEDGWRDLSGYADYTVFLRAEESFLRPRLIARRVAAGVDPEEAARFIDYSDMPNARLCLEHSLPADLRLFLTPEGRIVRDE